MKVPALATVATLVVLAAAALGAQDPDRDGGRVVVDMYCAGSWERLDPTDPAVARQLDELMSLAAWEYLAQTNGTAVAESLEIPCEEDFATQPGFACIRDAEGRKGEDYRLSFMVTCPRGTTYVRLEALVYVPPPPQPPEVVDVHH